MEKLVFETSTMRFVFCSEDAKVLGGIKLAYDDTCKAGKGMDYYDTLIKHLHNKDIKIERVEILDEDKNIVATLVDKSSGVMSRDK